MAIQAPTLELRNEEKLAAEAIGRISGALTPEVIRQQIAMLEELLVLVESGNLPELPICPELTNANPGSAHTVLIEAFVLQLAQMAYRINQFPDQNAIAFANLFKIEPREASKAETTLRFSISGAPGNSTVIIPVGAQVSDSSGVYVFETLELLEIVASDEFGEVPARRTVSGHTLLAPNVLTNQIDPIAFVQSVTNPSAVDSGSAAETLSSVLERARQYQRRAERMVSDKDLEEAILTEVLNGSGYVRAFPFVKNGNFDSIRERGHTTVVAMTGNGLPVDAAAKQKITALFEQLPGNQYAYIVDPVAREFSVSVKIKVTGATTQNAVRKAVEDNLRAFYAPSRQAFGRKIRLSEIIEIIERTAGVDHIVYAPGEPILITPTADVLTKVWEVTSLVSVTITIVN